MDSGEKPFVRRLFSLIRDAAAVIAAILIAFAIDAWWDARSVARDTDEALASLEAELGENQALLHQAITDDSALVAAVNRILRMDADEVLQMDPDSANRLLITLIEGTTLNPSEGALRSVLSTGVLEEIDSPELRQAIAGLPGAMADLIEEMDQMWMAWGRFVDYGIETGTYLSFVALTQGIGPQDRSAPEILAIYLGDERFKQILANLASTMDSYRVELEWVGTEIDRTRDLLLAELGR